MNLLDALKEAYDGWVRSATRTGGKWVRLVGDMWRDEYDRACLSLSEQDLKADNWEPKEHPPKPLELEIWVDKQRHVRGSSFFQKDDNAEKSGWRKIRVREVVENG